MLCRDSIAAIALTVLTMSAVGAQAHDESKFPDWSGQWIRVPDGGPPRYDTTKPLRKQEAPLKPEYQTIYEVSLKDIDAGGFGLDTHYADADRHAAANVGRFPLRVPVRHRRDPYRVRGHDAVAPPHLYGRSRLAEGSQKDLKEREPTFVGYSLGKWLDTDGDGRYDTLEIETRHVRGPRTWDQTGMPMAEDNAAVFKERIYLDKANPGILHDEITTTDNSLTRPWTVVKNYRRQPGAVTWEENNCVEGNAYITINKQVYVVSGDGLLMPSKKDQPPPDLKYFRQSRK